MVTGPLFKWFGSKWLSSRLYPPPEQDVIFEPYSKEYLYVERR